MPSYCSFLLRGGARLWPLLLAGCVDPYLPEVANMTSYLLVVDGYINGNGRTHIKLVCTTISAATATPPVFTATPATSRFPTARALLLATTATTVFCVDCRTHGSNAKLSFW